MRGENRKHFNQRPSLSPPVPLSIHSNQRDLSHRKMPCISLRTNLMATHLPQK